MVGEPRHADVPRPGPQQAGKKLIQSVLRCDERHEVLRRAGIGSKVDALARIEIVVLAGEGSVVVGRQAAQSGQQVYGGHRHRDPPFDEIGERGRRTRAGRLDPCPRFDGGGAWIGGVHARDHNPERTIRN